MLKAIKETTSTCPRRIFCLFVFELETWSWVLFFHFSLEDWSIEGFHLAKNVDWVTYIYSGYLLDSPCDQKLHNMTAVWVKM